MRLKEDTFEAWTDERLVGATPASPGGPQGHNRFASPMLSACG
jgi:hypothetical protein